jgi:Septum formation
VTDQPAFPPPAVAKPGGKRAAVIVVVLIAFLGVVLWMVKDNGNADDLKVGDCFDVPSETTVTTVTHHGCTEPHTAEVFHVVEFSGSDMTTPLTFVIDNFVDTACTPVFATYTGTELAASTDLTYGWFYPTVDGWQNGDRTITCYITKADDGLMTTSVKAGA